MHRECADRISRSIHPGYFITVTNKICLINQLNCQKKKKKKIRKNKVEFQKNKFLSDAGLLNLKKWSKEQMSHNLQKNIKYWNAESRPTKEL